jgi:hypothetical protein
MRGLRSGKTREREDEGAGDAPSPAPVAVAIPFGAERESLIPSVEAVAQYTAPDLSLFFLAFFALITYCHEAYYAQTIIVLAVWAAIQVLSQALTDDFRTNLFWNVFALLGNLLFYLFIGYCWSMLKLYMDIWQGHLPDAMMERIRVSVANGAIGAVLLEMKWSIMRWMITWPASVVYTFSRDPLRIVTELLFEWSKQRYMYIISTALQHHDQKDHLPVSWATVGVWCAYTLGYLLIGYAWTHIKLFIDVWQAALPPSLEAQVLDVYRRQASYWEFVQRIKWLVFQWMITWPFSIVYTVLRHPCRMLADLVYQLSHRKFVWIVRKAMDVRHTKSE